MMRWSLFTSSTPLPVIDSAVRFTLLVAAGPLPAVTPEASCNVPPVMKTPPAGSALAYVCAIAYVDPASGVEHLFEGRCSGRLADEPRGEGGFGYDPAFLADDGPPRMTIAQLSDEQKDAISHRGHAVRALLQWLEATLV